MNLSSTAFTGTTMMKYTTAQMMKKVMHCRAQEALVKI